MQKGIGLNIKLLHSTYLYLNLGRRVTPLCPAFLFVVCLQSIKDSPWIKYHISLSAERRSEFGKKVRLGPDGPSSQRIEGGTDSGGDE